MKLTKENLNELKDNDNTLNDDVINYVLGEWDNYDNKESIFTDVLNYGCQSGTVGHLVYYSDTLAYYEEHKDEINNLLYNAIEETGLSTNELFRGWDKDDPLAIETNNRNLLAWFGFEETMRNIALKFEHLQDRA